nr:glycosyl hydrolase family 43 [uncultured Gellertiella sp.]
MISKPRSDFWKVGVVPAPAATLLDRQALAGMKDRISWLPDPGPWRYLADPFGLWRGDSLHIFVEAYDYRTKHGHIEHHQLEADLQWRGKGVALARPVHLSYPFLIEADGETFMIPESHKAGEVALYRARAFPDDWVRETPLLSGIPAAEASVLRVGDIWWMFYTVVGPGARDQRELHLAFADRLTGPWTTHPHNPVMVDRSGARPGGTPMIGADGAVILPVQDCHLTYGGALRFVRFDLLTPTDVACSHLPVTLTGDLAAPDHPDGLHSFTACGDLTLIDVKRIHRSHSRHLINLRRRLLPKQKVTGSR